MPALSIDGIALDQDRDTYTKLLNAWIDFLGFDFVKQARERGDIEATALGESA